MVTDEVRFSRNILFLDFLMRSEYRKLLYIF